MDLGFLSNPINTLIISILILLIVGAIVFIIMKRGVVISKETGVSFNNSAELAMTSAIPRIERQYKEKLQHVVTKSEAKILGILSEFKPVERMLVLNVILEEIKERIAMNHFAIMLATKESYENWVIGRVDSCINQLLYTFDYCEIKQVNMDLLRNQIQMIIIGFIDSFSEYIIECCLEKIQAYTHYINDTKCKQLIAKNEGYVAAIKSTLNIIRRTS